MLVKTLLLAALGVVGTTAQLTNSTLLSILNTTQLSPSSKFVQLLQSSPDYQPILDLLSQPGNLTLFVPSDAVFDRLIQEFNETQQSQAGSGGSGSSNEPTGSNGSGTGTDTGTGTGGSNGTSTGTGTGTGGSNGTGTGTGTGTGSANEPGSTNGAMTISNAADGNNGTTSGSGGNDTMSGGGGSGGGGSDTGTQQNSFPQGFTIFGNFSVADIISYHIVQEKVFLQNETNQTVIVNSMLSNQTADKFGYGMPLIINSNVTQQNTTSSSSGGASGGNNNSTSQGGTTSEASSAAPQAQSTSSPQGGTTPETSSAAPQAESTSQGGTTPEAGTSSQGGLTPEMGSWISRIKQLMMAPASTDSSGGGNSTQTPVFWIGNGLSNANVTMHDIEASNGVLHVIDNVLIPPGNASNVFANISDASALSDMIVENPEVSQALNNATNVTIFAPNDKGLCMVCIDQLGQDKWKGLVMNHVVPGIYYSTNLTDSSGGSSPASLTTEAGESLPVTSNSSGITLNDTIKVVTPNILFNGGVIHLIDKIIAPPSNTSVSNNGTAAGPTSEASSSAPMTASPSETQPTSSATEIAQTQAAEQPSASEQSPEENPVGVAEPDPPNPHPHFDNPLPPTSL